MIDRTKKIFVIVVVFSVIVSGIVYYCYRVNHKETLTILVSDHEDQSQADEEDVQPQTKIVKVYITGEVLNPGVYELPEESRIEDVVNIAGGLTSEADREGINLAEHISDAQHVKIPKTGDVIDKSQLKEENSIVEKSLVNINTDNVSELMTLPGIGAVTAGNIIDYRTQNGNFKSIDEIKNVTRIGDKTFERIKQLICVD